MFPIPRRIRVVTGGDGVLAPVSELVFTQVPSQVMLCPIQPCETTSDPNGDERQAVNAGVTPCPKGVMNHPGLAGDSIS